MHCYLIKDVCKYPTFFLNFVYAYTMQLPLPLVTPTVLQLWCDNIFFWSRFVYLYLFFKKKKTPPCFTPHVELVVSGVRVLSTFYCPSHICVMDILSVACTCKALLNTLKDRVMSVGFHTTISRRFFPSPTRAFIGMRLPEAPPGEGALPSKKPRYQKELSLKDVTQYNENIKALPPHRDRCNARPRRTVPHFPRIVSTHGNRGARVRQRHVGALCEAQVPVRKIVQSYDAGIEEESGPPADGVAHAPPRKAHLRQRCNVSVQNSFPRGCNGARSGAVRYNVFHKTYPW